MKKKPLEKPCGFNREGFAGVSVKVSLPTYMKVAFFLTLNSFWEEIGRFTICTVKLRGKYSVCIVNDPSNYLHIFAL